MSMGLGRSNRTRLGVRGVRASLSGGLCEERRLRWPGWTMMSSSSSEELPERRPRSSSFIGGLEVSPSLRTLCDLALAMPIIVVALCLGVGCEGVL